MDAGQPHITVTKHSAYILASTDLLMDEGVIPDTRPPRPPPPWRTRLRWRLAALRDHVALRAYQFIAGHDPELDEDD